MEGAMTMSNINPNLVVMIPKGFRFNPTEEELIIDFLVPKATGQEMPWNVIADTLLYGKHAAPWEVFRESSDFYWTTEREGSTTKESTFVFTNLIKASHKNNKANRIARTAGGGTWHGESPPKELRHRATGDLIGYVRTFKFKPPKSGLGSESESGWHMHEYSLPGNNNEVVLCRVTKFTKDGGGEVAPNSNKRPAPPPEEDLYQPTTAHQLKRFKSTHNSTDIQPFSNGVDNNSEGNKQKSVDVQTIFHPNSNGILVERGEGTSSGGNNQQSSLLPAHLIDTTCFPNHNPHSKGGGHDFQILLAHEELNREEGTNPKLPSKMNNFTCLNISFDFDDIDEHMLDNWLEGISDQTPAAGEEDKSVLDLPDISMPPLLSESAQPFPPQPSPDSDLQDSLPNQVRSEEGEDDSTYPHRGI